MEINKVKFNDLIFANNRIWAISDDIIYVSQYGFPFSFKIGEQLPQDAWCCSTKILGKFNKIVNDNGFIKVYTDTNIYVICGISTPFTVRTEKYINNRIKKIEKRLEKC